MDNLLPANNSDKDQTDRDRVRDKAVRNRAAQVPEINNVPDQTVPAAVAELVKDKVSRVAPVSRVCDRARDSRVNKVDLDSRACDKASASNNMVRAHKAGSSEFHRSSRHWTAIRIRSFLEKKLPTPIAC